MSERAEQESVVVQSASIVVRLWFAKTHHTEGSLKDMTPMMNLKCKCTNL